MSARKPVSFFPIVLDNNKESFDADGFRVSNVGIPLRDTDAVNLGFLKSHTINNLCHRPHVGGDTKNTSGGHMSASGRDVSTSGDTKESSGWMLEPILNETLLDTIISYCSNNPSQETKLLDYLLGLLHRDNISIGDDAELEQQAQKQQAHENQKQKKSKGGRKRTLTLANNDNFYAGESVVTDDASSVRSEQSDKSETPVATVETPVASSVSLTEIFQKKSSQHRKDIVGLLKTAYKTGKLTHDEVYDVINTVKTSLWTSSNVLEMYNQERRRRNILFDQKDLFLTYRIRSGAPVLSNVSPGIFKDLEDFVVLTQCVVVGINVPLSDIRVSSQDQPVQAVLDEENACLMLSNVTGFPSVSLETPADSGRIIFYARVCFEKK